MNTVSFSVRTVLIVLGLGLLSACGGGGGGGGNGGTPSTHSMSGVVVDPAIAGATVTLRSASGNALAAVVTTDNEGRFTINYPAGSSLSGAVLTSRGGEDVITGYSFRNAVLSAPVTGAEPVVSLLTSLVQYLIEEESLSAEAATQQVALWYGLSEAAVLSDPRDSAAVQYSALRLAGWLNALRDEEAPVTLIAGALLAANGDQTLARQQLIDNARAASTADNFALLAEVEAQFDASGAADAEQVAERFTLANLRVGMAHHINEYIGALNLDDPVTAANFDALVQAVWHANGRRGVPLDSARVVNLIRYALNEGEIELADLADENFTVPTLSGDRIAGITAARDAIDHTLPLAPGEFLGSDNARRLAYFYASDLSPFYRAERIFDGIMDDNVLDPLYQSIAAGQAAAGLLDQALVTLETRIFQAGQRIEAQKKVAQLLGGQGRTEDAREVMMAALDGADRIIASLGGPGFVGEDEAEMLISLVNFSRYSGNADLGERALEPLYQFALVNAGNADVRTLYGRVIGALGSATGLGPVPDAIAEYESGNLSLTEAEQLLAVYKTIVLGMPPLPNGTETVKALYLAVIAVYEDRLGQDPWPTVETFLTLREQGTNVDSSIRYMADVYGRNDRIDEFLALADTISSASQKSRALAAIAAWQTLAALEEQEVDVVLDELLADEESLGSSLDTILWTGTNYDGVGLLNLLIGLSQLEAAAAVIEYAGDIVGSDAWLEENADSANMLGSWGCAKVAFAWYRIGDRERADAEMDSCLAFMQGYSWSTPDVQFFSYSSVINNELVRMSDLQRIGVVAERMLPLAQASEDSRNNLMTVARFSALAGLNAVTQSALSSALESVPALPLPVGDDQSERNAKIALVRSYVATLLSVRETLRSRIVVDGVPDSDRQALLGWLETQVASLLSDNNAPLINEALALNSSEQRANAISAIALLLVDAGYAADAVGAANQIEYRPDREAALGAVAAAIVEHDDFPGSLHASRDLDGDGRPDFFDPVDSSAGENPFELDDNIDGDGCPDSQDRRPFFATDGLADCAA
ncbi:hypothetical protein S7S_17165 [Isoalcanivorax pacificus W11-5]|uniref:Uncharacterized protein n=1 Tax=Isoalcanivorax pacificus W11-5 TaxID=391936 RepID=A0A0B4XT13_9GAMM|nr:carboxypeptidase-like regulatory domain-containing protein [Isoalcanivorax pacificus]AJD49845.1 hypothetical protein S7S_17165 [Isoalcanivorax pacificus W11-5]